ncbi:MAG TPA: hypothetical protein VFZ69_14315 [Longimicrobiales bacterium]
MPVLAFVLVIIFLTAVVAPLAKGIGERIGRSGGSGEDLVKLREELERADQRLAETERRLQLAEERLDFQEKLLSSRSSASRTSL